MGRLRPRAGVGASASRRLRGRSLRGEGARAAAAAELDGSPGRLTFVAHSSKSGLLQSPGRAPGAVGARIRPEVAFGVAQGVLLGSISDSFWAVTEGESRGNQGGGQKMKVIAARRWI